MLVMPSRLTSSHSDVNCDVKHRQVGNRGGGAQETAYSNVDCAHSTGACCLHANLAGGLLARGLLGLAGLETGNNN